MRFVVCICVFVVAVAGQQQQQQQQQEAVINPGSKEGEREAAPHYYYPSYQPIQNRNGAGAQERSGLFSIAGSYAQGLVVTFLFILGTILLMDIFLGDINILKTLMGRAGRAIWEGP